MMGTENVSFQEGLVQSIYLWAMTMDPNFEHPTLETPGGNLTVDGAARRLGCSTDKILDYLKLGWITGRKQGQELVVDAGSVEAFLDSLVSK